MLTDSAMLAQSHKAKFLMPITVFCQKLQAALEGFDMAPYPGPLGERIVQSISKKAWNQWLVHQTMLINEYRLSMIDPKARQFLAQEMEKFLFGEGADKPASYIPTSE